MRNATATVSRERRQQALERLNYTSDLVSARAHRLIRASERLSQTAKEAIDLFDAKRAGTGE